MSATITRREALGLLAASFVTVVSSPAQAFGVRPSSSLNAELDAWVAERLGQADMKGIAEAWKAAHPGESSSDVLTRAILTGRRRGERLDAYLSRVVAEEHRTGRAEVLDGWFLAPTEARIAALASLSS